jgi:hypothetical protein
MSASLPFATVAGDAKVNRADAKSARRNRVMRAMVVKKDARDYMDYR